MQTTRCLVYFQTGPVDSTKRDVLHSAVLACAAHDSGGDDAIYAHAGRKFIIDPVCVCVRL